MREKDEKAKEIRRRLAKKMVWEEEDVDVDICWSF